MKSPTETHKIMSQENHQKDVQSAMKVFLSLAVLIYSTAIIYSFVTKNLLGEILLISGAVVATGIIFYVKKLK